MPNSAPHVERMIAELHELGERKTKLDAFIDGPAYAGLTEMECDLLKVQSAAMDTYGSILAIRINIAT